MTTFTQYVMYFGPSAGDASNSADSFGFRPVRASSDEPGSQSPRITLSFLTSAAGSLNALLKSCATIITLFSVFHTYPSFIGRREVKRVFRPLRAAAAEVGFVRPHFA